MKTLKVFETFAGIGAQTKALKNISVDHEVVAISEWNIDSIISYGYIHHLDLVQQMVIPDDKTIISELSKFTFSSDGKTPYKNIAKLNPVKLRELYKCHLVSNNFGSILEIKGTNLPNIDLLTYSFPCQAISNAGSRKGLAKGTETSSSLLWEIERILLELKEENRLPSYLLMENVAALLQDKNMPHFNKWINFLDRLGYETKYDTLIATDFDIPQIRNRVFAVSILNNNTHDSTISFDTFAFPRGKRTKLVLKDFLETEVDEKYYNDKLLKFLPKGIIPKTDAINLKCSKFSQDDVVCMENGYSMTLTSMDSNTKRPKVLLNESKSDYGQDYIELENFSKFETRSRVYSKESFSPTLCSSDGDSIPKVLMNVPTYRIRMLTPIERLKLMGFTIQDYENLKLCPHEIKDQAIAMQCGNSIVVNVLEAIFKNLFQPIRNGSTKPQNRLGCV